MKPPDPDFLLGLAPVWSYGEALALAGSHLLNGDPGFSQILIRHYSAQSQAVSQLESSGTMPTSKFTQISPSKLLKHLRTGLVQMPLHILTTRIEPRCFTKSSVPNQIVHMQLSLRLSFYLRRSLRGYMVGTTVVFQVEIVETLAPQSRHQIPRKCPQ
jgi:hypothetical protein